MAIYCVYWRASGWNESTLGRPHTGSTLTNATKSGITAGDTIYPVSYMRGQLLVLGRFVVQMITDGEKPVWALQERDFYAHAQLGTGSLVSVQPASGALLRQLYQNFDRCGHQVFRGSSGTVLVKDSNTINQLNQLIIEGSPASL